MHKLFLLQNDIYKKEQSVIITLNHLCTYVPIVKMHQISRSCNQSKSNTVLTSNRYTVTLQHEVTSQRRLNDEMVQNIKQ